MSYRITLGFNATWAEFCVPRDGDLDLAVLKAVSEFGKVIALDTDWRDRFLAAGEWFDGPNPLRVRLANPEDLTDDG